MTISVGKTCMSNSIVGNSFNQFSSATIGATYLCKNFKVLLIINYQYGIQQDKKDIESLVPMYARCSNVLILVVCKRKNLTGKSQFFIGQTIILNTQQLVVNFL